VSLFNCIDDLGYRLESLRNKRPPWYLFGEKREQFNPSIAQEIAFLSLLKSSFEARTERNDYAGFDKEIALIDDYEKNSNKTFLTYLTLVLIKYELRTIAAKFESKTTLKKEDIPPSSSPYVKQTIPARITNESYKKFQQEPYLVISINQEEEHLGLSKGYCYGFTLAMVDSELSPYKKVQTGVHLNRQIHDYQRFFPDRNKDQGRIKRTRLTREYFCPDFEKQAEEIYALAKKNKGKELCLVRRGSIGSHASYVSMQNDGCIRFADANHGAYLFKTKAEFNEFYQAESKINKAGGLYFKFYSIEELREDRNLQLKESISSEGKIRSLLTGTKYADSAIGAQIPLHVNCFLGAAVGAGIGAIIGSIVPVVGTAIGAAAGCVLGFSIAALLSILAIKNGHRGLLGVPHYLLERWHHHFKVPLSEIEPGLQQTNIVEATHDTADSSTAKIIRAIPIDSLSSLRSGEKPDEDDGCIDKKAALIPPATPIQTATEVISLEELEPGQHKPKI
jgi:hypothetical protein